MKKLTSLFLALAFVVGLAIPTLAADVTPTPPSWITAEEYTVFSDGVAYQKDNWDRILRLRADAEAGNPSPQRGSTLETDRQALKKVSSGNSSVLFELGLLAVRYASNEAKPGTVLSSDFEMAAHYAEGQEPACYLAHLWNARCNLWGLSADTKRQQFYVGAVEPLLAYKNFTVNALYDCDFLRRLPAAQMALAKDILFVTLDGSVVHPRVLRHSATEQELTAACVRNNRTMVPLRRLAELMGATVAYDAGKITIVRAADTIVMTIGEKTAYCNGKAVEMDAIPYAENGRTYIPIRYIGEFFGQSVRWVPEKQQVEICENKAVVAPSNLEAWALPMGAMLNRLNKGKSETSFGGLPRYGAAPVGSAVTNRLETTGPDFGRFTLKKSWNITGREELIQTICSMTTGGHNQDFLKDVAYVNGLSASEYSALLANASGADKYMFPYTKQLHQKWGDRGIVCWDLFRMSNLVQWGYLAGFVTYPEALALLEPAAKLLSAQFTSWDEAYENYLDGYYWWAREDVSGQDIWETERGVLYTEMKSDPAIAGIFDNALFQKSVIPVPNITANELLKSVTVAPSR